MAVEEGMAVKEVEQTCAEVRDDSERGKGEEWGVKEVVVEIAHRTRTIGRLSDARGWSQLL